VNAVIKDRDEIEARVSICRVDCVWIVVKVRDAKEADGRSAREGRVIEARVYDVPVKRPREIVPTNLVMLIGHGIFAIVSKKKDFDSYQEVGQLLLEESLAGASARRWRGQIAYSRSLEADKFTSYE